MAGVAAVGEAGICAGEADAPDEGGGGEDVPGREISAGEWPDPASGAEGVWTGDRRGDAFVMTGGGLGGVA